uniref:Uncharacterized protein TCIL3000_3_110 n=1 Tax=Trypanosoma congolense (strain IL3000) TaxID=1068625 RepID=G0UJP4_TRYCI|nr:unnamed protein product [Trypanosoma congolense IL3000]
MLHRDPGMWNPSVLNTAGGAQASVANPNGRGAAAIPGSAAAATTSGSNNSYAFLGSGSASVLLSGGAGGMATNPTGPMPATASHERSQELCKYYINGGCLRGAQCQYLHELPDERHLDVNGFGYILNPNVHNAQKTLPLGVSNNSTGSVQVNGAASSASPLLLGLSSGSNRPQLSTKNKSQTSLMVGVPPNVPFQMTTPAKVPPPKYRPPEPFLEYNLPPTLALPLKTPPEDVALQLTRTMLQSGLH